MCDLNCQQTESIRTQLLGITTDLVGCKGELIFRRTPALACHIQILTAIYETNSGLKWGKSGSKVIFRASLA